MDDEIKELTEALEEAKAELQKTKEQNEKDTRRYSIAFFVLGAIIIIGITVFMFVGINITEKSLTISEQKSEIKKLTLSSENLELQNSELSEKIKSMEEDYNLLQKKGRERAALANKAQRENWEIKAYIVDECLAYTTPSGECYHRYNCPHLGDEGWIYNVEAARSKGYSACSDCNPPIEPRSFEEWNKSLNNNLTDLYGTASPDNRFSED